MNNFDHQKGNMDQMSQRIDSKPDSKQNVVIEQKLSMYKMNDKTG